MASRSRTVTVLVVLGFVAFLLWSTLSSQRSECTVTVNFHGQTRTATASAASASEALDQAQNVACGPITNGMDESIACSNRPPAATQCRSL
jgi:hypothetical protein